MQFNLRLAAGLAPAHTAGGLFKICERNLRAGLSFLRSELAERFAALLKVRLLGYIRLAVAFSFVCLSANAQWHNPPTPGAPRAADGKVDMSGPCLTSTVSPILRESGRWKPSLAGRASTAWANRRIRNISGRSCPTSSAAKIPRTPYGAELLAQHCKPGVVGPNLLCLPDGVPHADLLPDRDCGGDRPALAFALRLGGDPSIRGKTSRLMVVHEDCLSWGYGAEIAARIASELFSSLDAPVGRVAAVDTWIAYHPQLEHEILPQVENIAAEADWLLSY